MGHSLPIDAKAQAQAAQLSYGLSFSKSIYVSSAILFYFQILLMSDKDA